jgi:hypothetical protein
MTTPTRKRRGDKAGTEPRSQVRQARDFRAEKARRDADERSRLQRQNAVVKAIEDTRGMVHLALAKADVAVRTHYDWLERYPRYKEKFDGAVQRAYDLIEFRGIITPAHEGNYAAAEKFLAARCPDRGYGRVRSEISGPGGRPIEVNSPTLDDLLRTTGAAEIQKMVNNVKNELGPET